MFAEVPQIGQGCAPAAGVGDKDDAPVLIRHAGQGMQHEASQPAEYRGAGSDAEREGKHHGGGEAGRFCELTEGVTEIGEHEE